MVVHEDNESGFGEGPGESLQPVLLDPGEPVRHRDGRVRRRAVGHKQPAPQRLSALDGELDIVSLHHRPSFVLDAVFVVASASTMKPSPTDRKVALILGLAGTGLGSCCGGQGQCAG